MNRPAFQFVGAFLALTALCALSRYCLSHSIVPFIWIGAAFTVYFLVIYLISTSTLRVVAWNLTAVTLLLTICECLFAYRALRSPTQHTRTASDEKPGVPAPIASASLNQDLGTPTQPIPTYDPGPSKHPAPDHSEKPAKPPAQSAEVHQNQRSSAQRTEVTLKEEPSADPPWIAKPEKRQPETEDDYLLGYRPRKNIQTHAVLKHGDALIYDVTYTVGNDHLRVGAPLDIKADSPCVLFFGDSFIFGEGMNDDQTIPYRFEVALGGRIKAINFGYSGYGPQQMLMRLEEGKERDIIAQHKPIGAVYLAIEDHIERGAGRSPHDFMGPRYFMNNGQLTRTREGPFTMGRIKIAHKLDRSYFMRSVLPLRHLPSRDTTKDLDLFIAMVDRSRRIFEERYHGQFTVILWWNRLGSPTFPLVVSRLRNLGVRTLSIDQVIADYDENYLAYELPWDGHPTAIADQRIAEFLGRELRLPD